MEQLNKTPTSGRFSDVAKVLDTNFGLVVAKLMELDESSKAKEMNCGFYSSESELKTAYPNPDKGMMAYVGSGTDYKVYRCKADGKWTATSETFKVNISVDLSTYATKDALQAVSDKADALMQGAVYCGMATRVTNPGTPKSKVFYLPTEVGDYTNFGGLSVAENEVAFLYYDGTEWKKHSVDFSTAIKEVKATAATAATDASNALKKAETANATATANKQDIATAAGRIDTLEKSVEGITSSIPKMVSMTETAYEALEKKDPDTYYMLTEE